LIDRAPTNANFAFHRSTMQFSMGPPPPRLTTDLTALARLHNWRSAEIDGKP
jgi:hypothetical protein